MQPGIGRDFDAMDRQGKISDIGQSAATCPARTGDAGQGIEVNDFNARGTGKLIHASEDSRPVPAGPCYAGGVGLSGD
jgi:hypothetical protein